MDLGGTHGVLRICQAERRIAQLYLRIALVEVQAELVGAQAWKTKVDFGGVKLRVGIVRTVIVASQLPKPPEGEETEPNLVPFAQLPRYTRPHLNPQYSSAPPLLQTPQKSSHPSNPPPHPNSAA